MYIITFCPLFYCFALSYTFLKVLLCHFIVLSAFCSSFASPTLPMLNICCQMLPIYSWFMRHQAHNINATGENRSLLSLWHTSSFCQYYCPDSLSIQCAKGTVIWSVCAWERKSALLTFDFKALVFFFLKETSASSLLLWKTMSHHSMNSQTERV